MHDCALEGGTAPGPITRRRTTVRIPDGYGIPVGQMDAWILNPDVGVVTHGHRAEASNHGGGGEGEAFTTLPTVQTDRVTIAGFQYAPGCSPGGLAPIPSVARGHNLTFTNLDAAASIFHTVTACKNPCNGGTGISYPLANGAVDFDSLELGYGPPTATAAANRIDYTCAPPP